MLLKYLVYHSQKVSINLYIYLHPYNIFIKNDALNSINIIISFAKCF